MKNIKQCCIIIMVNKKDKFMKKKRRDKICTLNELGDIIESTKDF